MKNKFVVINGKPRAGKDAFVKQFRELYAEDYSIFNVSSVDPVKNFFARLMDGETLEKDAKYRATISGINDLWCLHYNGKVKHALSEVSYLNQFEDINILFYHIREKDQILKIEEAMKKYDNWEFIKLGVVRENGEVADTILEKDLDAFLDNFDYIVYNNDSDPMFIELTLQAELFHDWMFGNRELS